MQRAPIVLSATAAGLAATLSFHARAPEKAVATATTATTAGSSSSPSSSPSSTKTSTTTGTSTGTGSAATQYGDVQLQVTVSGGKITAVEALALPQNDPRSSEISTYAEPLLQQSALQKQDGTVDAVSGATFTSDGYATALQAALDQAGFATAASTTTN